MAYGPALTSYGPQFKLKGYVWGDGAQGVPPVALMLQGGFTRIAKGSMGPPALYFATNDNLSVGKVSGFYGGRLTQHAGAFVQVTYNRPDPPIQRDNLYVRYVRSATLLVKYIPFGKLESFAKPWLNLRVGVQYTAYERFNGTGANYDGFGRSPPTTT